jgi:hypothetical protein
MGYWSPEIDSDEIDVDWFKNDIYGVGIIMLNLQINDIREKKVKA